MGDWRDVWYRLEISSAELLMGLLNIIYDPGHSHYYSHIVYSPVSGNWSREQKDSGCVSHFIVLADKFVLLGMEETPKT